MPTQGYRQLQGTDLLGVSYLYLNDSDESLRRLFEGTSAPPAPAPYQFWADTTTGLLKQRDSTGTSWIVVGKLNQTNLGLLSKDGGAMSAGGTAHIDMNGSRVVGLGLGSGTAAARQQEVDLKAPLASPAFTTDATLNVDPPTVNSLVRRSWSDGRYLKLSGGTLVGSLLLQGNAVANLEATPLQQLRDFTAFSLSAGHRHDGVDARKIRGTDIDSGATPLGQTLIANGAGLAVWTALLNASALLPVNRLNTLQVEISITNVDLGAQAIVGIGVDTDYFFLPKVKASGSSKCAFRGLQKDTAPSSYGAMHAILEHVAGFGFPNDTIFAIFRYLA